MSFEKTKRKNFRKKRQESSDEEEDVRETVETARELQKIRKRQAGVSAVSLATGAKVTNEQELLAENDPFQLATGGLVDMRKVKDRNRDRTYEDTDRDVTNLGTTFSAETNRRDEDAELTIFIEKELQKRKGQKSDEEGEKGKTIKSAEDELFSLPEHLKIAVKKQSEEMLSNQMLSGIPEVDLGIEVKIKNIERTEEAKQKLIREQLSRKKQQATSFVPTNMAANYVQHRRYQHNDEPAVKKKEKPEPELAPLVVGDTTARPATNEPKKRSNDKASDDYHYDKFRKAARRY